MLLMQGNYLGQQKPLNGLQFIALVTMTAISIKIIGGMEQHQEIIL